MLMESWFEIINKDVFVEVNYYKYLKVMEVFLECRLRLVN